MRLETLLDYPLITTVAGTSIRLTLERAYQEQGRSLRVTHSVTQHQTIVAMVGAGLGVALLPALSSVTHRRGTALVTDPQITRDIGVVQRKGEAASAAAREFADAMRRRMERGRSRRSPFHTQEGWGGRLFQNLLGHAYLYAVHSVKRRRSLARNCARYSHEGDGSGFGDKRQRKRFRGGWWKVGELLDVDIPLVLFVRSCIASGAIF